ncbi:hypothetical protein BpHYR1_011753 [Brachionus plicatilis]|uniref:Uncharacterized protein n=1 Tax=Brachionus plicatilis TaxID=10195 RepID=A0A3M7P9E6_BRAPC|nr:hypothetical protein BpHYR1_011753 [Brachionus plicatilis]
MNFKQAKSKMERELQDQFSILANFVAKFFKLKIKKHLILYINNELKKLFLSFFNFFLYRKEKTQGLTPNKDSCELVWLEWTQILYELVILSILLTSSECKILLLKSEKMMVSLFINIFLSKKYFNKISRLVLTRALSFQPSNLQVVFVRQNFKNLTTHSKFIVIYRIYSLSEMFH